MDFGGFEGHCFDSCIILFEVMVNFKKKDCIIHVPQCLPGLNKLCPQRAEKAFSSSLTRLIHLFFSGKH